MLNDALYTFIRVLLIAAFDVILCYFVISSLLSEHFKKAIANITVPTVAVTVGSFAIGVALRLMAKDFDLPYLSFLALCLATVFVSYYVIKTSDVKTSLDEDVLMIFGSFIINQFIFFMSMIPAYIVTGLPREVFLGMLLVLGVLTVVFVDKLHLPKFALFVSYRLAVKVALFAIGIFLFVISIFLIILEGFELEHAMIPLIVLIILGSLGFYQTLKAVHQYEIVVPEKYRDMKKILSMLYLSAQTTTDREELICMITTAIELMGVQKIEAPEATYTEEAPDDFEAFIHASIETLKLNAGSVAEVRANIQYFEPHKNVSAMTVNYMLTTLLENAFETGTTLPIYIDILSTSHIMFIKVANESEVKDEQMLENMLKKGYSSKGKVGRGFGLSKLAKLVASHEGTMTVNQEMRAVESENYLSFTLNF